MLKPINKIFFFLLITIFCSCGNQKFVKHHVDIKEKGNQNCIKYLQTESKSIYNFIAHKESIMLLKNTDNSWSEISKNKINKKYKIPNSYSHIYELRKEKWINYEFFITSNDSCNCEIILNRGSYVAAKLSIYEELIADVNKMNFIREVGKSEFNNEFRLIIFGEEDSVENIVLAVNGVSIPETALDLKFKKFGFLITAIDKKEEPFIYFNKALLIDINSQKILGQTQPIL